MSAVAALLCCAPLAVSAFHFYLEPGASRCFLEQLPKDTLVVGASHRAVANGTDTCRAVPSRARWCARRDQ